MARKLLLIGLFALVAAPCAQARPVQLMPGVTYDHRLEWTPAGPVSTYVVVAPKPGGLYSLTPLLSNNTIVGRETVSSMERRISTQMTTVGVNGDFFNWAGGWPSGLLMQGGVLEHHPADGRAAVGIDSAGTLHVDRVGWFASWRGPSTLDYPVAQLNEPPRGNATSLFTPAWGATTPAVKGVAAVLSPFPPTTPATDLVGDVTAVVTNSPVAIPRGGAVLVARGAAAAALQSDAIVGGQVRVRIQLSPDWRAITGAVSAGPSLVMNGKPVGRSGEALTTDQLFGRNPRTAVGQRADGAIVFVAADGRRPGWSVGITNSDLALMLMRYGCVTGFALDSGGSTTVAFDGAVLNRPSDPGGERPVAEALVVGYAGVFAPSPAPTLSPNGDAIGDRESLRYKLVRPSSVTAQVVAPDGTARDVDSGTKQPGRYTLAWDGADAAEGRYRWSVSATDDLGRSSTAERTFTLDKTLGFPRVARNARTIGFTLTRDAAIRVTIEDAYGGILRTVASGRRAAGSVTAVWNGRDGRRKLVRSGTYVVRIAATSTIGLSELRLPLRVRR